MRYLQVVAHLER
jgi:hypothetical protein